MGWKWDDRYDKEEYIFGVEPNEFFRQHIIGTQAGTVFLPAEGEGRNAIFAARNGWEVTAVDLSEIGREKALKLAILNNVDIKYEIADLDQWETQEVFDVIGICYLHLPPETRTRIFNKFAQMLKPGGKIILECFSKQQIPFTSGGPKDIDMLYDTKELQNDFINYNIEYAQEKAIFLNEGNGHIGEARVVRMIIKR